MITEQDFIQWKNDRVTKEVLDALSKTVEELQSHLSSEAMVMGDQREQAKVLGYIHGLQELIYIGIDSILEEDKHD